jgi:hypothetical protein
MSDSSDPHDERRPTVRNPGHKIQVVIATDCKVSGDAARPGRALEEW